MRERDRIGLTYIVWFAVCFLLVTDHTQSVAAQASKHVVPKNHPRLLGSRKRLQELSKQRSDAYQRVVRVAREPDADDHAKMISKARCAIVYDLCYEYWSQSGRAKFHAYMNKTVDENIRSETHVFHNGWYGNKHWGIGLACYASFYEN